MDLRDASRYIGLPVLAAAIFCALLLAAPVQTVSTTYVNDLLIFLEGGYRIVEGQVPNQDFHTALGPLNFYIPALGYWLTGSLGAAMPVGIALLVLMLAPIMAQILQSRMSPLVALPTGVFLLLVLVAPLNTGEEITDISFAMFYNRIGWAVLGLLLIMHLPAEAGYRRQTLLDGVSAALLVLLLLFTKVSYGLVGLAFLVLMLPQSGHRRWAGLALTLVFAGCVMVEFAWRGTVEHVADLVTAAGASGSQSLTDYLNILMSNRAEYLMCGVLVVLALWRRPRFADLMFHGFCAAAGLALISQNFQTHGVVTLYAGAAVAAETLWRTDGFRDGRWASMARTAAPVVLVTMLLPSIVTSASTLGLHTALAATRDGQSFGLPNAEGLHLAETINEWKFEYYSDYIETLRKGATLLASLDPPAANVLVMDFVSPFASLLGLAPPRGDTAWMHSDRNFDEEHHVPAAELFRDVEIVMLPLEPIAEGTTDMMEDIYGDFISEHYEVVLETSEWRVYRRS